MAPGLPNPCTQGTVRWALPTVTLSRPGFPRDPLSPPTWHFKGGVDRRVLRLEAPRVPTHFEVLIQQALEGQQLVVVCLPGRLACGRRSPHLPLLGAKQELLPPALQLPGGGSTQDSGSCSSH